jgi:hypothetical protein
VVQRQQFLQFAKRRVSNSIGDIPHQPLHESEIDTASAGGNFAGLVPNPNRAIELRYAPCN